MYNCKRYFLSLTLKECLEKFCTFMGIKFYVETPCSSSAPVLRGNTFIAQIKKAG